MRALTWELPALVIFTVLGAPDEDAARVTAGSSNRLPFMFGRAGEAEQMQIAEGMDAFWRSTEELVADRLKRPRQDFTSALARRLPGLRPVPDQRLTFHPNIAFRGPTSSQVRWVTGSGSSRPLRQRQDGGLPPC